MIWFEKDRIPKGRWPFLNTVRNGLAEIERTMADDIDLTEGEHGITITGCMRAYRQAVMRRALDLAQSVVASWNAGLPIGAVISSRALLETIAIYHSFLRRSESAAAANDWERIGKLVDAYAFSTSSAGKMEMTAEAPPPISRAVKAFIQATEPGKEEFWDQICDTAHPNGKRMLMYAGTLADGKYAARSPADSEATLFIALYNALYSCCWLSVSDLDFYILLEHIRSGSALPADHPLVVERALIDKVTADVVRNIGPLQPGPAKETKTK